MARSFDQLELATEATYHHAYSRGDRGEWRHELLVFALGAEEYGCDILRIREIIKPRPITELPRAPAFVLGIVSLRGQVLPVLDLRVRLRLPPAPVTKDTRVLIVVREAEVFGLMVDRVRQVVRLRDEEIEATSGVLPAAEAEFIAGIGRPAGGRMLILLNLDAVVAFSVKGP